MNYVITFKYGNMWTGKMTTDIIPGVTTNIHLAQKFAYKETAQKAAKKLREECSIECRVKRLRND